MTPSRETIENREELQQSPSRSLALDCLRAGIGATHPEAVVDDALELDGEMLQVSGVVEQESGGYDLSEHESILLAGGGNAAAHLARAVENVLGDRVTGGAVVTDDPVETRTVDVLPGDHPVPSERGVESARRVERVVEQAGEDDLVIGLLTGGGSALLPAPASDLSLDDLRETTEALLASGATIGEINAVRKHCSRIKGGRLARRAAPATVLALVVSDVIGDDLSVIASGPLSPDPTTYADARDVLDRYGIEAEAVRSHLRRGEAGELDETPTRDDPAFERVDRRVVANGRTAIDAAATVAGNRDYTPLVLSSRVRGEASEAAKTHAAIAEECLATATPVAPPAVLLSGGETTVTLADDHGTGGPNQEFVLSAGLELDADGIVVASVDTDGIDGATDAAGAIVDCETVDRTTAREALDRNDAYPVLDESGALIKTGPTGTNVNDLRVFVIDE
jgi:hydroxypyruvate reductase